MPLLRCLLLRPGILLELANHVLLQVPTRSRYWAQKYDYSHLRIRVRTGQRQRHPGHDVAVLYSLWYHVRLLCWGSIWECFKR